MYNSLLDIFSQVTECFKTILVISPICYKAHPLVFSFYILFFLVIENLFTVYKRGVRRHDNETHKTLFEKGGGEREREWECNGESELVQSTLYTCMELLQ
jgi:hypothetical protein